MAIDGLQESIRKRKNPMVVDFSVLPEQIPEHIRQGRSEAEAYYQFCQGLLDGLKELLPAVRFSFGQLALMGGDGLEVLAQLLDEAKALGYYVIMDSVEILAPWGAERAAAGYFQANSRFQCDALVISPYIGSDAIKPFIPYCLEAGKDIFMAIRTPNKSAPELQDLLTGSRLVHTAAADLLCRFGDTIIGNCGYSPIGALASGTASNALASLRAKYPRLFLLVDGYDYPGGNAKNCSAAFDRLGHGAAVCVGQSVTAAWYAAETDGSDYVQQAIGAVGRIHKNLNRYIKII